MAQNDSNSARAPMGSFLNQLVGSAPPSKNQIIRPRHCWGCMGAVILYTLIPLSGPNSLVTLKGQTLAHPNSQVFGTEFCSKY